MGAVRSRRPNAAPAVKSFLFGSGFYSTFRRVLPSRRLAILRYHAICGAEGRAYAEPGICVSPSAFEAHVTYLTSHYRVLSLPEAVRFIREKKSLPANAVALTFDDGYADNLWAASGCLRRELFEPPSRDSILDDMAIPMAVARMGRRVVFEPDARAYEQGSETASILYALAATTQAVVYVGGLAGCHPAFRRIGVVAIANYFCLVQATAAVGFFRGLTGRQSVLWRRFEHGPVMDDLSRVGSSSQA